MHTHLLAYMHTELVYPLVFVTLLLAAQPIICLPIGASHLVQLAFASCPERYAQKQYFACPLYLVVHEQLGTK